LLSLLPGKPVHTILHVYTFQKANNIFPNDSSEVFPLDQDFHKVVFSCSHPSLFGQFVFRTFLHCLFKLHCLSAIWAIINLPLMLSTIQISINGNSTLWTMRYRQSCICVCRFYNIFCFLLFQLFCIAFSQVFIVDSHLFKCVILLFQQFKGITQQFVTRFVVIAYFFIRTNRASSALWETCPTAL